LTTISDVAKRAGVSPVTVSRVINNVDNVSAATRAKVEHAIQELGYVPSGVAKSLRLKRTRTLALIVPDIQNTFWTTVARGVEDAAQSLGYSIFLCNTDENSAKQRHYLEMVVSQRVDGVIIAPSDSNAENLALLRQRNIPTVVMDRHIDGWNVDTVMGDSLSASRALVKHLIGLGHKRIAMISGPLTTSTSTERIIGYRIALTEAGLPFDPELIRTGEYRSISGEHLTHQLLGIDERPTAIFAANNVIALGAIDALSARGLRVPQDMALVCLDDLPNTSHLFPFLTVAVQPAYDLGANAAQLLLSRLVGEQPLSPRHVVLPTRLIIRHSCGSTLAEPGRSTLSLPTQSERVERVKLIKPFLNDDLLAAHQSRATSMANGKSDAGRIINALRHRTSDRPPHVEFALSSPRLYKYVVGRKVHGGNDAAAGKGVPPEEQVRLAQRLGLDAILCDFSWQANGAESYPNDNSPAASTPVRDWSDLERLQKPVVIADQLNQLERYLLATEGSNLGVFVSFDSFFDCALRSVGSEYSDSLLADRFLFERLLDVQLERQERVMQAVSDRFAGELLFVLIKDVVADDAGPLLDIDLLKDVYAPRMKRLIALIRDHELPVAISTPGAINQLLPLFHDIGFDIVHLATSEKNDLYAYQETWPGKFVFAGGFPVSILRDGSHDDIVWQMQKICRRLSSVDYLFGVSGTIDDDVAPENFVAMTQAFHQCKYHLST